MFTVRRLTPEDSSADVYSYEKAAEEEAELKELHRPLRAFYLKPSNEPLQKKHGEFPMFWKDLANWPGLREMKKRYLAFQDGVEIPIDDASATQPAAVDEASKPTAQSPQEA